jgi:hypothetical protein
MKVAKEFKFWNSTTRVSQGYFVEVDLADFDSADLRCHGSEVASRVLGYIAIRRAYEMALREGVITGEQVKELLKPFQREGELVDRWHLMDGGILV